jgi:hypothetical protein
MPRLVGKKPNTALYTGLGLLVVATGAIAMEYFGVVDFIPDFGKDPTSATARPLPINKPVN